MNETVLCVPREEEAQKPVVGGEMALVYLLNHQSTVIKKKEEKKKREPEAARGVELLCNYNMVLKSKYQAIATSAGRPKKGGLWRREGRKNWGRGS